jgi:hypothetical protein
MSSFNVASEEPGQFYLLVRGLPTTRRVCEEGTHPIQFIACDVPRAHHTSQAARTGMTWACTGGGTHRSLFMCTRYAVP